MVFAIKMSTSITSTIATPPQLAPGIYMGIHEFDFSLLAAIGRVFMPFDCRVFLTLVNRVAY